MRPLGHTAVHNGELHVRKLRRHFFQRVFHFVADREHNIVTLTGKRAEFLLVFGRVFGLDVAGVIVAEVELRFGLIQPCHCRRIKRFVVNAACIQHNRRSNCFAARCRRGRRCRGGRLRRLRTFVAADLRVFPAPVVAAHQPQNRQPAERQSLQRPAPRPIRPCSHPVHPSLHPVYFFSISSFYAGLHRAHRGRLRQRLRKALGAREWRSSFPQWWLPF